MAASCHGPVWITAERQTAGRGRRGRAWASPEGALAATLLLFPEEGPEIAALRSFVAALALADALSSLGVPDAAIALKWPNDVLVYDCKLAGILLESAGQGGRLTHLAIGIGINLNEAPNARAVEPGGTTPIALAQVLGRPVASDDMLTALARAYAAREAAFRAGGFAPIRADWLNRAARLGQPIRARTARETHEGTFDTLDDSGALVLITAAGRRVIPAADVFF